MEEQIGVVSQEATATEGVQQEQAKSDPEELKARLAQLEAELQQAKQQLQSVDSDRRGQSRAITRLKQELEIAKANILQEAQGKKLQLMAQSQEGSLDLSAGTITQQMKAIDDSVQQQIKQLGEKVVQDDAVEVLAAVKGILKKSGHEPDNLSDPIVAKVNKEWQKVYQSGGEGLDEIVDRAEEIVLAAKARSINEDEIKKKVEAELIEKLKKNPALRVDTSGANAGATGFARIEQDFLEGKVTLAEYKKARSERGLR